MEYNYLDLLTDILRHGVHKEDRTGVGTISRFGAQLRFDLQEGFPLLTTKRLYTKAIFGELIWFIRGDTNVEWLRDNEIHIWDEWADMNGDLGPVYGKQWRHWDNPGFRHIDQLGLALKQIKENPDSRRIIVSAWNPAELDKMALPPCHMMFQFEVHDGKLSCHMYQRSADMFLGVPFNIASYAALTHVMAHLAYLEVGDLIISFGDVHIYKNHLEQVHELLSRQGDVRPSPILKLDPGVEKFSDLEIDSFVVEGYNPHPTIKASVAV